MLALILSLLQAGGLLPPPPAGWRAERLALPPEFAPELELRALGQFEAN